MPTEEEEEITLIIEMIAMLDRMSRVGDYLSTDQCNVLATALRCVASDLERGKRGKMNGDYAGVR